jgi:acyl carrier protein
MFENVRDFLVEELRKKPEMITPDAELVGDLGINSLELAELILACEEKFNVQIDDEDLHRFTTVADIVNYLEENK